MSSNANAEPVARHALQLPAGYRRWERMGKLFVAALIVGLALLIGLGAYIISL